MKLVKTLAWLSLAGALIAVAPSAQATVKFKSSVTLKFTATIQTGEEVPTSDGFVYTTEKVTIVNKDVLEAFEFWYDISLPDGAFLALDEDYDLCIVDKDGDILFDDEDLAGFLEFSWSYLVSNGRYRENNNGYSESYVSTYILGIAFLGSNDRSADIDTDDDFAFLEGLVTEDYTEKYNDDKADYTETTSYKGNVIGSGEIEGDDAAIAGDVKAKYSYKDDNAL